MARVVLQNSNKADDLNFVSRKNSLSFAIVSTTAMLLIYFILSIGLTFYQSRLLKKYGFPLSVVSSHLVIKFICAGIYRQLWQCVYARRRVSVDCHSHVFKIAPIGFTSGLDIGFSNWGMEHVTISLYVMTKSTTVVFILGFALLLKLEKKSWTVIAIVIMISGGLSLFTYKDTQFELIGFLLVLFASFSSGLRWTLTQFVMQKAELGLRHPLDMLFHVQPWMVAVVVPLAIGFEGGDLIEHATRKSWSDISHPLSLIVAGAFIALALELSEYMVVLHTSSLTLSIFGIFKEICTLALAIELDGDKMSLVNGFGLLLCLAGIACHVAHKAVTVANEHSSTPLSKPLLEQASAHFLVEDSGSEDDKGEDNSSTEVLFSVLNSRNR